MKYRKRLSEDESQRTITKKMIRAVLNGKLTDYAYDKEIRQAIFEAEEEIWQDHEDMMIYDRVSPKEILLKNPSMIESKLRDIGLRIHGDK